MVPPAPTDRPLEWVELPTGETVAYRHRPGEPRSGGVPVVLLHGNMTSSKHFDVVLEAMDERFDLWAMDMRGFGGSTYETPVDSLADFAEDVIPFADAVGLETFHLLGWSTGGGVAMEVAARHPGRVERLVLVAPTGTRGVPRPAVDEAGEPTGELLRTREEIAADPVVVAPILQAFEDEDRETFRAIWDQVIYTHNSPDEAHYEAYVDDMLSQRNTLDVYYALAHHNASTEENGYGEGSGLTAAVTAPTLVIHGDRDLVIPREMVEQTVEDLPNAEFVELEDCGHSPPVDDLDGLLDAVESFLSE